MIKGSLIIYCSIQIAIYLVLGFGYELLTFTFIDQFILGSLSFMLMGLFFILTWKRAGECQLKTNQNSSECSGTLNIQQVQIGISSQQNHQFCQFCKIIQKPRSFHCIICKKCIPTYDHHCGFLGKCIGEKNRQIFYLFCLFQTLQSIIYLISLARNLIQTGDRGNDKILLISISLIVTFLMCTLLVFETYFMICNLTMEEFKKFQRNINKSKRYPYSKGILFNLYQFWILGFGKELIHWKQTEI